MLKNLRHIVLKTYPSWIDYGTEFQKRVWVNMFPLSYNTLYNHAMLIFNNFLAFQLILTYK